MIRPMKEAPRALVVGANVLLRGSNKNEKPESKKNR